MNRHLEGKDRIRAMLEKGQGINEVTKMTGFSRSTVRRYIAKNEIKYCKKTRYYKLDDTKIEEIKNRLRKKNETLQEIASSYNVSKQYVGEIKKANSIC